MKRNLAPEAKTAGAGAAAALATIVFVLNGWLHWFTPPPADVVVALSGAFSTLVGYVLPHTSRSPRPLINVTGDPSKQPAIITTTSPISEADLEQLKTDWRRVFGVEPVDPRPRAGQTTFTTTSGSVEPPAATTGGAS